VTHKQPFDENAALAELERLRASIEAARHARQEKSDEFDAFVAGFRNPAPTPAPERPTTASPVVDPPRRIDWESKPAVTQDPEPVPSPAAPIYEEPADEPAPAQRAAPRGPRRNAALVAAAAVVGLVVIGVVSSRWRDETPPPATANPVATNPAPPTQPEAQAPAPASSASSAPAPPADAAVVVDLKIARPVWMRIVVDGRKTTEGMVQPTESLRLTADRSIVVRSGNGGDVRVKTGSREEPFGEADQPLTRTFLKR
jgi:hypothetical protein